MVAKESPYEKKFLRTLPSPGSIFHQTLAQNDHRGLNKDNTKLYHFSIAKNM